MHVYNVFSSQSTRSYPSHSCHHQQNAPATSMSFFIWFLEFKDKECESIKGEHSPYRLGRNGAYKVLKEKHSQSAAPAPAELSFPSK